MATYNLVSGQNIQTQLDACVAGDIINLADGEYNVINGSIPSTGLFIDKNIKLRGASASGTVIDGYDLPSATNATISISGSGASATNRLELTNMTVKNKFRYAIYSGPAGVTVQFVTFLNLKIEAGGIGGINFGATGGADTKHNDILIENVEIDGQYGYMFPRSISKFENAENGEVRVTASGHGLNQGDITNPDLMITILSGIYAGERKVTAVESTSVFRIEAAFNGTAATTWTMSGCQSGFKNEDILQKFKVRGLTIRNIKMRRSNIGIGFHLAPDSGELTEKNTIWDVQDLLIEDCNFKGIYAEDLEQAYFKNVVINGCGNYQFATAGANGAEFNMKYKNYKNILMENVNITDCGTVSDNNSSGLCVKVRDHMINPFGTYGVKPASLESFVVIGGKISGGKKGLLLGEVSGTGIPECNMGPVGIDIRNFIIEGCELDTIHDARINRNGFIYNNRYFVS